MFPGYLLVMIGLKKRQELRFAKSVKSLKRVIYKRRSVVINRAVLQTADDFAVKRKPDNGGQKNSW